MYTKLGKTFLAVAISAAVSFPAFAVSEDQLQQLNKAVAKANQTPEEKKKAFHAYVNAYLDEYEAWRDEYTKNLDERRSDLIKVWGEGEVSSQTKDVQYSEDDSVKTAVDYEANEATVSILVDADSSEADVQALVKDMPVEVAGQKVELENLKAEDHAVLYSLEKEQAEKDFVIQQSQRQMKELDVQADRLINSNTGIPDSFIYQRAHNKKLALLAQAQERIAAQTKLYDEMRAKHGIKVERPEKTAVIETAPQAEAKPAIAKAEKPAVEKKQAVAKDVAKAEAKPIKPQVSKPALDAEKPKKVVSYKVKLPENSLKARASKYAPLAEKESKNWEIDAALIMAIMHSESAFRPDAKSHIPAFGLMQVVPTSAGHDVNKIVRKIDAPMKSADLYQPVINVETGTAFLNILTNRYMKGVENKESLKYCVIAAYNTGHGNVYRTFNKDRSMKKSSAIKVINSMTPDEVYNHMLANLPYDETKGYLEKVSGRISLYK
ncbi:transglycosylase SLT domain-containing protein [Vibrio maerlii]|uniref:transglycosylase SLT domain-containing protein n=1 Tax=Vibrio maerlii TaxID=2231648 RepID=UPI000E3D2C9F|nr:transglycosylase SLT domain-containing protein [Vibrio maerlii]